LVRFDTLRNPLSGDNGPRCRRDWPGDIWGTLAELKSGVARVTELRAGAADYSHGRGDVGFGGAGAAACCGVGCVGVVGVAFAWSQE
jgi:hypothetical protein